MIKPSVLIAGLLFLLTTTVEFTGAELQDKQPPPRVDSLVFRTNDVLAFLGGADVAAAQETGHQESLLTVAFLPLRLRCRNFGWEGGTVFDHQPRDAGFPTQKVQLQRAGTSVIFLQYGRAEALDTNNSGMDFKAGYEKLIEECMEQTPRLVLVTPPPFENGGGLLPDLSARNKELAACAEVVRELAWKRKFVLVDLFAELGGGAHGRLRLTENGLQLSPRGQALVACAFARQLGFGRVAERAGAVDANGRWSNAGFEHVRQAVIAKNQLWFNYWRPQNWAFLGGDRITQPSSRDHRNPAVRWFPEEMERFVPLIQQAETRISLAAEAVEM